MLVDTKKKPAAILPDDFTGIPFTPDDIVYTVGSHYIQKFLTRIDGTLYQLPKIWNIGKREWEPYSIFDWRQKPYNIHCDGCHTVGFDPDTMTFFEPGIGCESCHGPGLEHVKGEGDTDKIVNPAKLDRDRAMMICMACHTDGDDTRAERRKKALDEKRKYGEVTAEQYEAAKAEIDALVSFPFAAEFIPGKDLREFSSDFFMPKPKSKKWYWGTMDFFERKRMYYFFQSKFYSTARACEVCGFDRGPSAGAERYMNRSESCGTCHKERFERYAEHSGHDPETTLCTDCHVPEITEQKNYSIHDHKFDFSQPKLDCGECHDPTDPGDSAVAATGLLGKVEWAPEPEHHDFHIKPVAAPRNMTVVEACIQCHNRRDEAWAKEQIPGLIKLDQSVAPGD